MILWLCQHWAGVDLPVLHRLAACVSPSGSITRSTALLEATRAYWEDTMGPTSRAALRGVLEQAWKMKAFQSPQEEQKEEKEEEKEGKWVHRDHAMPPPPQPCQHHKLLQAFSSLPAL